MLGLDLRFVQDRAEDGQLFYRLDPPLDAFVQYDGHRSKEVGSNRYAVRQLISREVEAQIIKQRGALAGKAGPLGSGAGAVGGKKGATGTAAQQVRDMIEKEKPALDFFGRPVEKKKKAAPPVPSGLSAPVDANGTSTGNGRRDGNGTRAEAEDPGTDADPDAPPAKKFKVFYRYNEGFSNAVRRPAKISALL